MVKNVLATDISFKGTIKFKNYLKVNCFFDGIIQSDNGELVVDKEGILKGVIKTGYLINFGEISGKIDSKYSSSLEEGSKMIGDIQTKELEIKKGAIFDGSSRMNFEE